MTPVFATKEQEELFAECAREAMLERSRTLKKYNNYDASYISEDTSTPVKCEMTPIFATKEQEELFAECAREAMFASSRTLKK